jgi:hypothetical protein
MASAYCFAVRPFRFAIFIVLPLLLTYPFSFAALWV